MKNKFLDHLWEARFWYNKDGTIKRITLDLRDTVTSSPQVSERTTKEIEEFVKTAKGAKL